MKQKEKEKKFQKKLQEVDIKEHKEKLLKIVRFSVLSKEKETD